MSAKKNRITDVTKFHIDEFTTNLHGRDVFRTQSNI